MVWSSTSSWLTFVWIGKRNCASDPPLLSCRICLVPFRIYRTCSRHPSQPSSRLVSAPRSTGTQGPMPRERSGQRSAPGASTWIAPWRWCICGEGHDYFDPCSIQVLPTEVKALRITIIPISTDNDCCAFAPFPETIKLRIRGFFCAWKNFCRTCHCEVKCRKALWLEACEALWSSCKRTQTSWSRFFLQNKYELLLRSLRSNNCNFLS